MYGNRKRFSLGWYTGVILGIAASGAAVYAVTLPHTFTDGTTASAAQVNANLEALRDAINGTGSCGTANASDEMVRVGAFCIDKNPAALYDGAAATANGVTSIPAGCNANGSGCTAIFAQSRATHAQNALRDGTQVSWARAARACANAGKRLPTAGEWATAHTMGVTAITGAEWVDGATGGSGSASPFPASHMRVSASGLDYFSNPAVKYDATDASFGDVGFRCAR